MNFWEKITGSDMTKEFKSFESRKTYADIYQESVDQEGNKTLKRVTDKTK